MVTGNRAAWGRPGRPQATNPGPVVGPNHVAHPLRAYCGRGSQAREVESAVAKNTGQGHRVGAVKGRSEFKVGKTWFKRDTATGRILGGSSKEHKGVRNEK